ncbi:TRAP transporter small permease [Nocardioides sp. BYT-33-1]|uniref:TRAP transporter small permease n=1 Tax=Nocardioides sp. BYT-33-1 TaxID=3416952 RepID=UPI003F52AD05
MTEPQPKSRATRAVELAIEVPAVLVTFVMMVHITANAISRTFFDNPMPNTLEITQYWYLPIVAFLGFIAAQLRGQHVAADLLYERFPAVTRKYVLAVVFLLAAAVSLGFARYGWDEAVHAMDIRKTAGVSDLPAWQPYFLAPIAFASLTVQFAYAAIHALVKGADEGPAGDPDELLVLEQFAADERGAR